MLRNWSLNEFMLNNLLLSRSLESPIGNDALILERCMRSESAFTWPAQASKNDPEATKINIKIILNLFILTFLISDSRNKILDFPESFWCSKSLFTKDFIFSQFSISKWRPYCWYVGCFKRTISLYFEINKSLFRSRSQSPRWFIFFIAKSIFQTLNFGLWTMTKSKLVQTGSFIFSKCTSKPNTSWCSFPTWLEIVC